MRDLFNVGGVVPFALLFAAQRGGLPAPRGGEFPRASLLSVTPILPETPEAPSAAAGG